METNVNLIGKKFNYLTVESVKPGHPKGRNYLCRCVCGRTTIKSYPDLVALRAVSCGCKRKGKHKMSNSPTYRSWRAMRLRCLDPDHHQYKNYGARNITISPLWVNDFVQFMKDMGERRPGTTIDRIDNEKGYYKDNCKWSTPKEQQNNTRQCVMIEYMGRVQNMTQWCDELGLDRNRVGKRIIAGWDPIEAMIRPKRYRFHKKQSA